MNEHDIGQGAILGFAGCLLSGAGITICIMLTVAVCGAAR